MSHILRKNPSHMFGVASVQKYFALVFCVYWISASAIQMMENVANDLKTLFPIFRDVSCNKTTWLIFSFSFHRSIRVHLK